MTIVTIPEGAKSIKGLEHANNIETLAYYYNGTLIDFSTLNKAVSYTHLEIKPGLTSLSIDGITLNEPFNPDKEEYTAVLEQDIESMVVNAVANIEGAVIEIEGEDDLNGENSVNTIKVKSPDGSEEKIYTINITKKLQETKENVLSLIHISTCR